MAKETISVEEAKNVITRRRFRMLFKQHPNTTRRNNLKLPQLSVTDVNGIEAIWNAFEKYHVDNVSEKADATYAFAFIYYANNKVATVEACYTDEGLDLVIKHPDGEVLFSRAEFEKQVAAKKAEQEATKLVRKPHVLAFNAKMKELYTVIATEYNSGKYESLPTEGHDRIDFNEYINAIDTSDDRVYPFCRTLYIRFKVDRCTITECWINFDVYGEFGVDYKFSATGTSLTPDELIASAAAFNDCAVFYKTIKPILDPLTEELKVLYKNATA